MYWVFASAYRVLNDLVWERIRLVLFCWLDYSFMISFGCEYSTGFIYRESYVIYVCYNVVSFHTHIASLSLSQQLYL